MWPLVVVWVVVIAVGALLWQRFTRLPPSPVVLVPGQRDARPRRVVPLWLALVLLILLVSALWFTLQWGSTRGA